MAQSVSWKLMDFTDRKITPLDISLSLTQMENFILVFFIWILNNSLIEGLKWFTETYRTCTWFLYRIPVHTDHLNCNSNAWSPRTKACHEAADDDNVLSFDHQQTFFSSRWSRVTVTVQMIDQWKSSTCLVHYIQLNSVFLWNFGCLVA